MEMVDIFRKCNWKVDREGIDRQIQGLLFRARVISVEDLRRMLSEITRRILMHRLCLESQNHNHLKTLQKGVALEERTDRITY